MNGVVAQQKGGGLPFSSRNEPLDPRRRLLIETLTAVAVSAALPATTARGQTFTDKPAKLPPNQSIYRITGSATVNGAPATLQTQIRPGDTVETAKASEIVFVVGSYAMMLRADSRLAIEGETKGPTSILIRGLRLLTGKLLSVSRNTHVQVTTAAATIGIRGTGWYAESDPAQTYFCTCYGVADISATHDPASREVVASKHHDRPLYILAKSAQGRSIRGAPAINHTDQELVLIEALAGRAPPFTYPKERYEAPKTDY